MRIIFISLFLLAKISLYSQINTKLTVKPIIVPDFYGRIDNAIDGLPTDLATKTILFLKFDSISLPKRKPRDMSRYEFAMKQKRNSLVQSRNKQLKHFASKYPFKYKIISMDDTKGYFSHGAKYVLWLNSFDAFTKDVAYNCVSTRDCQGCMRTSSCPKTAFGIVDLTTHQSYLIKDELPYNLYGYGKLLPMLFKKMMEQYGIKIDYW